MLPPLEPGGQPVALVGCGVRSPAPGAWARCSTWPLPDDALEDRPQRLAVVLGSSDADEVTRGLASLVAEGAVEGADVIVPAQTLRALAQHNPAWTGRQAGLRVLGISCAAVTWGGRWDLDRLAAFDGGSGRRINTFDGAGFALIEVRRDREAELAGPDDPEPQQGPDTPSDPRLLEVVAWEDGRLQAILRPTPACDLRCPHCFVPPFAVPSAKDIDRALAQADVAFASARDATLVLSGGEPLLSPDLDRVVRWALQRPAVRISLQTHATGVPRRRDTLDALVKAGLGDVLVNLPSFDEAVYLDLTGGVGNLHDALDGVDVLVGLGLQVTLNVVITCVNADRVEETIGRTFGRWGRRVRVTLSTLSPNTPRDVLARIGLSHMAASAVFDRALEEARQCGIDLVVAGGDCAPPACLLPPDLVEAGLGFIRPDEPIRIRDDRPVEEGVRYKRTTCSACRLDDRCPGVAGAHVAVFGMEGMVPLP